MYITRCCYLLYSSCCYLLYSNSEIKMYRLIFSLMLISNFCLAEEITVFARPGGKYILPKEASDYRIRITGSVSINSPFYFDGNGAVLSGNSYIKIINSSSHIVIRNITFKNNLINYKNSTSLIEVGSAKHSSGINILIEDINFVF